MALHPLITARSMPFWSVANPLGECGNMHWNGLTPLGGNEVMATCQRNAELLLVRGRIRAE